MATIRKRETSGGSRRYDVRYRDTDGRQVEKTFRRHDDAKTFAHSVETDKRRGDYRDPSLAKQTVNDYADRWLATLTDRKANTVAGYVSILNAHVRPALGDKPVGKVRTSDVEQFVSDLHDDGMGSGTVKNVLNVLKPVLGFAVRDGAILTNPAVGVKAPRPRHDEQRYLTAEEVVRLSDAIEDPYGVLVVTAAWTGLRAGELAALRVKDVDLASDPPRLQVCESVAEVGGRLTFEQTKNRLRRSVPMPAFLAAMLADYLEAQGVAGDSEALVFTDSKSGTLRHSNFYRRTFKPAVKAAGLDPELRFHDLRHTAAALMIEQGAHPRAMMERLGHSSITVTLDTYGHLLPTLDEALTDGLDARYKEALAGV